MYVILLGLKPRAFSSTSQGSKISQVAHSCKRLAPVCQKRCCLCFPGLNRGFPIACIGHGGWARSFGGPNRCLGGIHLRWGFSSLDKAINMERGRRGVSCVTHRSEAPLDDVTDPRLVTSSFSPEIGGILIIRHVASQWTGQRSSPLCKLSWVHRQGLGSSLCGACIRMILNICCCCGA